jgi:RNA-directed DNA polymerase
MVELYVSIGESLIFEGEKPDSWVRDCKRKRARGWMNYFGISEYYCLISEIDHWLRRRMRMYYWKQWRHPRTKIRNLRKRGTSRTAALDVVLSRKGPWRLAHTLATQTGMTNHWLKNQGFVSVKELWVNIHYPATARLTL